MINSEIGDLMLLFESLQLNNKNNIQLNTNKSQTNPKQFNKNSQLGFKYELINKNIEIFRNKIIETHQLNTQNIFKLEKSVKESEKNYKEVFSERDSLIKENSLKLNSINEIVSLLIKSFFRKKNIQVSEMITKSSKKFIQI